MCRKIFIILLLITGFVMNTAAPIMSWTRISGVRGKIVKFRGNKMVIHNERYKDKKTYLILISVDTDFTGICKIEPEDIKDGTYGTVRPIKRKGPKLEKGKTDAVYTAKKISLEPDDEEKETKIKSQYIKGFISVEKGEIKVEADGKVYTFKIAKNFEGVFKETDDVYKEDLKKGVNVNVTGKVFGNSIKAESIEVTIKQTNKQKKK